MVETMGASTAQSSVLVCGETLADLVAAGDGLWRAHAGGGPANTAVALARLGTAAQMLARISGDPFGRASRQRLADNGVGLQYVVTAQEPSTIAIVDVDAAGVASYSFYLKDTADWQWDAEQLPGSLGPSVAAVHAGSMALIVSPGAGVLEAFLAQQRADRVVSVDVNVRSVVCPDRDVYRAAVERWVGLAHILKASEDDIDWLYPGRGFGDVLDDWASRGPALVVVTRGPHGAVGQAAAGARVVVPSTPLKVVDTIGAGDTFSAGLLHALRTGGLLDVEALRGTTTERFTPALTFAERVAAISCTRAGADPPYASEL